MSHLIFRSSSMMERRMNCQSTVPLVKLGGHYFLDLQVEEFRHRSDKDLVLFELQLIPIDSFACLDLEVTRVTIRWFKPDWLRVWLRTGNRN